MLSDNYYKSKSASKQESQKIRKKFNNCKQKGTCNKIIARKNVDKRKIDVLVVESNLNLTQH